MVQRQSDGIHIKGAREHNLKNISVTIPKHAITVFTGVSGSGKSSLVFDTIAAESQRQLNETYPSFIRHRLAKYGQPDADLLENLSVSIVVDQKRLGDNARSTVGTVTDIYTFLRLLFSRVGTPFVGYSNVFSFNDPAGMCPRCQGIGAEKTVNIKALIDTSKSLNEGAINFPTFQPGGYRWKRYAYSGLFDNDKKLQDYTEDEWDILLNKKDVKITKPLPGWPQSHRYRGILIRFQEDFFSKNSRELNTHAAALSNVVIAGPCPECHGARLNKKVLSCKIDGKNIAECAAMQITDLLTFLQTIKAPKAATIRTESIERLQNLAAIGLDYLSLDRQTSTLSGGESQRIKMVKHLGSSLSDICYIFDEPSIGLHPSNVAQLNALLQRLRDRGNTVLVVEHDPDVIKIADHIVDMGPHAGSQGGEIVFEGTYQQLQNAKTLTAQFLHTPRTIKVAPRKPTGNLSLHHASLHNLHDVSVDIPTGVLTVVTGVAGSGKSTLINHVFAQAYPDAIKVDQSAIHASKRSNPASFLGILDPIRLLLARANNVDASLFSFNGKGACPECKGLGYVSTDLAFMDPIVTICELCKGRRFTKAVLDYTLHGKSIDVLLDMNIEDACSFFKETNIAPVLQKANEVGVGYLTLGQPLNTLSGGERQRIKLALELQKTGKIYILDEPTTGLHMSDISRLMHILSTLVDKGSTVIVIEHNTDVIRQADWVIELGPGAGHNGGRILFEGTVADMKRNNHTITGRYL
jgi:excinuclease UvrABC ATPase subunit